MTILGNWGQKLGDAIAELTGKKVAAAAGAAVVALGTAAWVWLYNRVNPKCAACHIIGLTVRIPESIRFALGDRINIDA
jgi:hypothetical protein